MSKKVTFSWNIGHFGSLLPFFELLGILVITSLVLCWLLHRIMFMFLGNGLSSFPWLLQMVVSSSAVSSAVSYGAKIT